MSVLRTPLAASALLAGAIAVPPAALAQQVVTSRTPERLAVTIYRNPEPRRDGRLDLAWLQGYALVTEQRTVSLPAGRATLRFEGVAGGMLPESAIVTGLPAGVREKNLDADLLSPRSLYAHALGRPVILRRRDEATGKVVEEEAIIRSAPDGAAVLETRAGFEAADCGPLKDSLSYPGAPPGLVAKPTLSVETEASAPTKVTLTLSYLAWGFDWRTNYVVRMEPGARRAQLSAWVTLASGDATSFPDADVAVVGGEVNHEARGDDARPAGWLAFSCFVSPLTSPLPSLMYTTIPPLPVPPVQQRMEEVFVTARRLQATVVAGELGDLKTYRVPCATTLAARSQKQVAMIAGRTVKLTPVYTANIRRGGASTVELRLRGMNRKPDGLGIALPSGQVAVFEPVRGGDALVGEGSLGDKAVGEAFEIGLGRATQVAVAVRTVRGGAGWREVEVTVSNANPWAISFEAPLDEKLDGASTRLSRKNGQPLWRTRVPANGVARLRYTMRDV